MTWSIVARDKTSGHFGIAVATCFFAAGALVPYGRSRVGAIATQALVNPFFGTDGLRLLEQGRSAQEVASALTEADPGRDLRQVHLIDGLGRVAAYTGSACDGWSGHVAGDNLSIAGNMLAGSDVIARTAACYERDAGLSFPRRLIAAMRAGEAAGGDKRGKQSAALVIYGEEEWPDLNLRVDDHPDPLAELERLEGVSREAFVPFQRLLPSRADPVGVIDRRLIESDIARTLSASPADRRE